jgi:hypothetical protein
MKMKKKKSLSEYMKRKIKKKNEKSARDRAETIKNYESALANYKVALARYNELASKCEVEIQSVERILKSYTQKNNI